MTHTREDHDHVHHETLVVEDGAGNLEGQARVAALQNLLIERNLLTAAEVARVIERIEAPGTHVGARLVARAWVDPSFKALLLSDGKTAALQMGTVVDVAQLVVLENTDDIHNLICCTLCSCYPRAVLGQPPAWYTSKSYRARAVREPRKMLAEFGLVLPEGVRVVVHDSVADMRYLVLPQRPVNTAGLDEAALAALVSRDCMIGTAVVAEKRTDCHSEKAPENKRLVMGNYAIDRSKR